MKSVTYLEIVLVFILHGALAHRKWTDEFLQGQWPLLLVLDSVFSKHFLTSS